MPLPGGLVLFVFRARHDSVTLVGNTEIAIARRRRLVERGRDRTDGRTLDEANVARVQLRPNRGGFEATKRLGVADFIVSPSTGFLTLELVEFIHGHAGEGRERCLRRTQSEMMFVCMIHSGMMRELIR